MNDLWKDRKFVWFLSGQTLAQFGAAIAMFTIPWLLLERTGSAASTGFAFAIGFIPYLLLSLPAGVWADRFSRSKMMIGADLGRLIIMLSLPVSYLIAGEIPVFMLFVVQAILSALAAVFDSAYGAYVPLIVDKEKLSGANSALQSGTALSQILGPALGGSLVSLFGGSQVLLLTTATYLISVISILRIRRHEQHQPVPAAKRQLWKEIREGFTYVWNQKLIRTTGIFSMLANLVVPSSFVALLYKLQTEMQLPSDAAGLILASWSAGMVIGSMIYGRLKKLVSMKPMLTGVLITMIIPPVVLASASGIAWIVAAHCLAGLTVGVWNITLMTLRQTTISPEIMGRALTSIRLIAWCSLPVGNLIGGTLSQTSGTSSVFVFGAAVQVFMLLLSIPLFKQMGRPASLPDERMQPIEQVS